MSSSNCCFLTWVRGSFFPLVFWPLKLVKIPWSVRALNWIARSHCYLLVAYPVIGVSLVAQLVKNPPAMQETLVQFMGWKFPGRRDRLPTPIFLGFTGGSDGKESACNAGDLDSIPGWGRSPGGGHGNPCQYSCLESPHGQRSLAGYSPWGHKELDMTEQLSTYPLYRLDVFFFQISLL